MAETLQKNRVRHFIPTAMGEFDNLFDHFFGHEGARASGTWRAPVSVWEADQQYHVELDVPGVAQEDVQLTFDKGVLSIAVERKLPEGERKGWHNERAFGKVTRSITLPEAADADSIEAELTAGVLHITIAKRPEAQPKRIEIKTG